MSSIDILRDALFGNPPSPAFKPSREGVLAAFTTLKLTTEAGIAAAALSGTNLDAAMALVAPLLQSSLAAQRALEEALAAIPESVADQLRAAINTATAEAEGYADAAASSRDAAQLAAATALASSRYFPSRSAGEAGSTTDQAFTTDDGAGNLIYYRRTSGGSTEIGRAVTPAGLAAADGATRVGFRATATALARTLAGKVGEGLSVLDFIPETLHPAIIAGTSAVDLTSYLQNAIDKARSLGGVLHVPPLTFQYNSTLMIAFDEGKRGFTLSAEAALNYYGEPRQASFRYTGNTGYAVEINGGPNGAGQPMQMQIKGIRFLGNNNCLGAIGIVRAWIIDIEGCSFSQFGKSTGGTISIVANGSADAYAGIVNIERCAFAACGRNILLTGVAGGQVNVVRVSACTGVDQRYSVVSDWNGALSFTSNILIEGNHFEGTTGQDFYSDTVANNWLIMGNYVEDNTAAAAVQINGAGNTGIEIIGNDFRKSGLSSGQALAYVQNATGVTFKRNIAGFGGADDIYSSFFVSCLQVEACVAPVAGADPNPIYMNGEVLTGYGTWTDMWSKAIPNGEGKFAGVSSGDGFPGGTIAAVSSSMSFQNGRLRINAKATITKKSSSGDSVIIGVLPSPNHGPDVTFPVYTENVSGTKPFYAVLPNMSTTATVYDANGTALGYQGSVANPTASPASIFRYNFDYISKGIPS